MTHRILLMIDVPDPVDPINTDPHDIAEDMVDEYNLTRRANGEAPIEFVSARWIDG